MVLVHASFILYQPEFLFGFMLHCVKEKLSCRVFIPFQIIKHRVNLQKCVSADCSLPWCKTLLAHFCKNLLVNCRRMSSCNENASTTPTMKYALHSCVHSIPLCTLVYMKRSVVCTEVLCTFVYTKSIVGIHVYIS